MLSKGFLYLCGSVAEDCEETEQQLLLLIFTGTAGCHASCKCFPIPGVLLTELLVSSGQHPDLEQAYPTLVTNKYLIFLPKVRPELDVTLKGNKFIY